jgi:DNA primase
LPLIPWGLETLHDVRDRRAIVVTEGESDCLSVRATIAAIEPSTELEGVDVIALPGSKTWHAEWVEYLAGYATVYIAADGDQAGREMTAAILADYPSARPVLLPEGIDCRELLQRYGPDALDDYFVAADRKADEDVLLRRVFSEAGSLAEACAMLRRDEFHAAA